MKASEFIEPSCFLVINYIVKDKFSDIKDKNNDKVEINISYELIEELDKRFIDREELKEKIKKLLELYKFKYTYELDDDNEETVVAFNFKLEEEILKLLEE